MDEMYMKKALDLAKAYEGFVEPNPMVGAIIVKDEKVIGTGAHQSFGDAHAEVNAFNDAKESVEGATMYVTLEPCSHYGKTPPCADLIIKKNIKRVVIASLDPNPLVAGNGIKKLKDARIDVDVGVLDKENKALNKVFFKFIQTKLPYVVLKTAMTADGKIASYTHDSKWITNHLSRQWVHELRAKLQGIMVGVNTVIYDDPKLNVRLDKDLRQPLRIILDTRLEIPLKSYVVKTAAQQETIIITTSKANQAKYNALLDLGVTLLKADIKEGEVDIHHALIMLGKRNISSLLLEGGSAVNFSALKANVVDEMHCFIAPKIIGGMHALSPVGGLGIANLSDAFHLKLNDILRFDDDVCLSYTLLKEK